eukprot:245290-Pyramimonas_sp.AAC.1
MDSSVHDVVLHHQVSVRSIVIPRVIRWIDLRASGGASNAGAGCPAERGAAIGAAGAAALAADAAPPTDPLGVLGVPCGALISKSW